MKLHECLGRLKPEFYVVFTKEKGDDDRSIMCSVLYERIDEDDKCVNTRSDKVIAGVSAYSSDVLSNLTTQMIIAHLAIEDV
jgi:hypothetical protein